MQKLFSLAIFVLISTHVAYANPHDIAITPLLKLIPQSQHLASEASHYQIDVEYPELNGTPLPSNAARFNQMMNDLVSTIVTDFKVQVVENSASTQKLPAEVNHNRLSVHYKATVLIAGNDQVLSIRLDTETEYAGAAHPLHKIDVVNYQLNTGKLLHLDDLFKPRANYLDLLSTFVRSDLANKVKMDNPKTFDTGTAPESSNFQHWNLQSDGILVTFNEDQVAAYVFGQPEVLVPYNVFHGIVASQSPIAICLASLTNCTSVSN